MKIVKNIIRLCAAALAVLPIFGCSEEEYVKPSALLSESSLTFEAIGAEPQSLTIASDEACSSMWTPTGSQSIRHPEPTL